MPTPSPASHYFENLLNIHKENLRIELKYPSLRSLLEALCREFTDKEGLQFSNLFSRLNYVCKIKRYPGRKAYQVHSLRVHANNVLHRGLIPDLEDYQYDVKALADTIAHFYETHISEELKVRLPEKERTLKNERSRQERHRRARIAVDYVSHDYIYGQEEDFPTEEPVRIRYNVNGVNDEFNGTVERIQPGALINILDFTIEKNGDYVPDYIVLEPDYLVDVSSIAECHKDYGDHPLNFLQSKLQGLPNTHHIILGNIANAFLDEVVHEAPGKPVELMEILKKVFKESPFNISSCEDLPQDFFKQCEDQFMAIKNIVGKELAEEKIDTSKVVLEPTFYCEALGLQGRLDLMLEDYSRIVELKSGKAETFNTAGDTIKQKENHYIQTLLYYALLTFNIGRDNDRRAYILYSKYGRLLWGANLVTLTKRAINKRNLIIANERGVAFGKNADRRQLLRQLNADILVTRKTINENFLNRFILPQLNTFYSPISAASPLMLEYFLEFWGFLAREHYLSKSGENSYERRGLSGLWLTPLEDKLEEGEIFIDLRLSEPVNVAANPQILKFIIPSGGHSTPNFRKGDIVVIYQRNLNEDNATNKQLFRGSLKEITSESLEVRLRYPQRNASVLPQTSTYAMEHDYMEASHQNLYRGLYELLKMSPNRQKLLLGERVPVADSSRKLIITAIDADLGRIVLKAKQAADYFVLQGPPGTGKTSHALKAMVEEFYGDPSCQILLLAYTNRAVDEICETLERANGGTVNYVRIGSELSCGERFHCRLLDQVLDGCSKRDEVRACIAGYRIFVGTISSVSGKMELFKLKSFDVAIIDEASQILEPQLFPVLTATDRNNAIAIKKFVMIGDHKQLPAVVLQPKEDCKFESEELRRRGFTDKSTSLFERLYRRHSHGQDSPFLDMLVKQGRMHPELADFPNTHFYEGKLETLGLPHQKEDVLYGKFDADDPVQKALASNRLLFIPSIAEKGIRNLKTNRHEALIIKNILHTLEGICKLNGMTLTAGECTETNQLSVGIIVPYRSQIGVIRSELTGVRELQNITIDTVERYQGSQRDIIIYSFCVNRHSQLRHLSDVIMDNGKPVDRKLNVAITRARKQLIVTGNPGILANDSIYYDLMEHVRDKGGYWEMAELGEAVGEIKLMR